MHGFYYEFHAFLPAKCDRVIDTRKNTATAQLYLLVDRHKYPPPPPPSKLTRFLRENSGELRQNS